MINQVKLFGERNTGSNYLEKLIQINLDDLQYLKGTAPRMLRAFLKPLGFYSREKLIDFYFSLTEDKNLGWKHACADMLDLYAAYEKENNQVLFLCLIKNPYSFLLSLYKNPYHFNHQCSTFSDFLRKEYTPHHREKSAIQKYKNPIEIWNDKLRSYFELKQSGFACLIIKYEDLIHDYNKVLSKIVTELGKTPISEFKNYLLPAKKDSKNDFAYYRSYYCEEKWKSKLKRSDILLINDYLDKDLVIKSGYNIL